MTRGTLDEELQTITVGQLEDDPYPLYERLHAQAPVAFIPAAGGWTATGYEAVRRVHEDVESFMPALPAEPLECLGEHNILSLEGPRHRRYRKALHAALSRPAIDGYADRVIGEVIDERLRLLDERQHVDLVADFFEPVSVLSVGRVIGVPELDAATLQHWFRGIILGSSNVTMDMDIAVEANAVSREIDEYMFDVFARVEKNPDDSIVSHLLQGAAGDTLVERVRDITPTLKVVIGGGLQEPGHGASTLAAALLADDGARADFNTDPAGLIKPAIEEAIRWVSPIQVNIRRTRIDTELEGVTLPAGTYVNAAVGAANRSVSVFGDDAAEFDLRRAVRPHLAFGTGMHFCAGNYFGRAAISRSIRGLFERFPEMRLDESDGPVRFRGFVFRSPAAVRVQLRG